MVGLFLVIVSKLFGNFDVELFSIFKILINWNSPCELNCYNWHRQCQLIICSWYFQLKPLLSSQRTKKFLNNSVNNSILMWEIRVFPKSQKQITKFETIKKIQWNHSIHCLYFNIYSWYKFTWIQTHVECHLSGSLPIRNTDAEYASSIQLKPDCSDKPKPINVV